MVDSDFCTPQYETWTTLTHTGRAHSAPTPASIVCHKPVVARNEGVFDRRQKSHTHPQKWFSRRFVMHRVNQPCAITCAVCAFGRRLDCDAC